MPRALQALLLVAGGGVSGVVLRNYFSPSTQSVSSITEVRAITPNQDPQKYLELVDRMNNIERRLNASDAISIRKPEQPIKSPSSSTESGPSVEFHPVALQERQAIIQQQFDVELDNFSHEGLEPAWASVVTPKIAHGLAQIVQRGAHFKSSIECRTSSCLVELKWETKDQASAEYMGTVAPVEGCATTFLMDRGTDGNDSNTGKLLYRCQK